jgi:hypothetical protein
MPFVHDSDDVDSGFLDIVKNAKVIDSQAVLRIFDFG